MRCRRAGQWARQQQEQQQQQQQQQEASACSGHSLTDLRAKKQNAAAGRTLVPAAVVRGPRWGGQGEQQQVGQALKSRDKAGVTAGPPPVCSEQAGCMPGRQMPLPPLLAAVLVLGSPHRMTWPMPMLNTNGCSGRGETAGRWAGQAGRMEDQHAEHMSRDARLPTARPGMLGRVKPICACMPSHLRGRGCCQTCGRQGRCLQHGSVAPPPPLSTSCAGVRGMHNPGAQLPALHASPQLSAPRSGRSPV